MLFITHHYQMKVTSVCSSQSRTETAAHAAAHTAYTIAFPSEFYGQQLFWLNLLTSCHFLRLVCRANYADETQVLELVLVRRTMRQIMAY
jgi:hypothetical protein